MERPDTHIHEHSYTRAESERSCAPLKVPALDTLGVGVSSLCAVHCVFTPVLLMVWPAMGERWGGTATHWIIAIAVVPLVGGAVLLGYRHHRKLWIPMLALCGVVLIFTAMLAPGIAHHHHIEKIAVTHTGSPHAHTDAHAEYPSEAPGTHNHEPVNETVSQRDQHASILQESSMTIVGSVLLILAHIANLRYARCRCRAKR